MTTKKVRDGRTTNPAPANPVAPEQAAPALSDSPAPAQSAPVPSDPPAPAQSAPVPSDPPTPEQSAAVIPTMAEIIAALLDDVGFDARLMEGLRTVVPGADEMVPAILASEDFVPGLKSLVDSHLDMVLPDLVGAALPNPGTGAPAKVEPAAPETAIDRTSREQVAAEKAATEAAARHAEQRAASKVAARINFVALIETVPGEVEPIDLLSVSEAGLLIDDGTAFSIDYTLPLPLGALSLDDNGSVRLRHEPIAIGDGMGESFPAKGVVLILKGEEGMRAARCEMPSILMVGGGQRAQLGADSLIFRIPR